MDSLCDLHTHSTFSDGTLTPARIVAEAHAAGLRAVALTDHNTVAGLPEFLNAARGTDVQAIPGVEISTGYCGKELHIVGLFIEPEEYGALTDFLRVIETGAFSMNNADQSIQQVRRKVDSKCKQLRSKNPDSRQSWLQVEQDLMRLGASPKTTYLYIQGHHLFDKVVVPMMTKICDKLIRQRQSEIARQSQHGTQRRNELSCYTNSIEDVIPMLKKNMGYILSEPYKRITADIKTFMESLRS